MNKAPQSLRCLLVDDEPHALDLLKIYIDKTPFLQLAAATTSPWEALELLRSGEIDLLFLDIQMEDLSGLQLLDLSQTKCPVILTTAYSEYALKGYEYRVKDYLLKPFSFERFLKAVSPIFHEKKMDKPAAPEAPPSPVILPHRDYLFVKGDAKNKYHKLILEDISYVEGLRNYVQFFCRDQKVVTLQNLKRLEEDLPADRFVRIHKSYIVHIDHIDEIEGQSVLINGRRLPIGQSYRTRFFSLIRDHRIGE